MQGGSSQTPASAAENGRVAQVHSVLVRVGEERCAVRARAAVGRLRPHVAGYGAFQAGVAGQRRVLPLNLVTLIVDLDGPGPLVFGARGTPVVDGGARWRRGVTVGLTPAGVRGLFGVPMRALTGTTVGLDELIGRRADELGERMVAAPDWAARFAVLDELFTRWLRRDREADAAAVRGWWRLQETAGRGTIGGLAAESGVSRRRLETGFRREVGLSPKTVARVARFQRAAQVLSMPSGTFGAAAACGFADQPHFNREVRAMAGITPGELRAFLQYAEPLTG